MRRIIKRKVYDSDSARLIGKASDGSTMHRKKTGEYFIVSDGTIHPRAFSEAMAWASANLDPSSYRKEFGEQEEGDDLVHVAYYLKASTVSWIRRSARAAGKQPSEFVEELLEGFID